MHVLLACASAHVRTVRSDVPPVSTTSSSFPMHFLSPAPSPSLQLSTGQSQHLPAPRTLFWPSQRLCVIAAIQLESWLSLEREVGGYFNMLMRKAPVGSRQEWVELSSPATCLLLQMHPLSTLHRSASVEVSHLPSTRSVLHLARESGTWTGKTHLSNSSKAIWTAKTKENLGDKRSGFCASSYSSMCSQNISSKEFWVNKNAVFCQNGHSWEKKCISFNKILLNKKKKRKKKWSTLITLEGTKRVHSLANAFFFNEINLYQFFFILKLY